VSAFVDTSALLAVLHAGDSSHRSAAKAWKALIEAAEDLVATSYVLVETSALLQHRFGLQAARGFQEDIVPVLRVVWVDEDLHREGMAALLTAGRRELSLVDCVSFACMRRLGLERAFHFDRHFKEQGFAFAGS